MEELFLCLRYLPKFTCLRKLSIYNLETFCQHTSILADFPFKKNL